MEIPRPGPDSVIQALTAKWHKCERPRALYFLLCMSVQVFKLVVMLPEFSSHKFRPHIWSARLPGFGLGSGIGILGILCALCEILHQSFLFPVMVIF